MVGRILEMSRVFVFVIFWGIGRVDWLVNGICVYFVCVLLIEYLRIYLFLCLFFGLR